MENVIKKYKKRNHRKEENVMLNNIKQGLINMINPLYHIREFVGSENLSNTLKKFEVSEIICKNIEQFLVLDFNNKDAGIIKKNRMLFLLMTGCLWSFQLIQSTLEPFPFIIDLKNLDFGCHLLLMLASCSLYFIIKTKFIFAYKPEETKEPEVKEAKELTKKEVSFKKILIETTLNENENIILGFTEDKKLYITNIKKNYHMIVAGSTGYGKSNFAHVWASSLIKSDMDASFFLLDPKRSELKRYRDIKRVFYTGERDKMIKALQCLEKEMDSRNELIDNEKYVNNLETWNKKYPNNKMHFIFIYAEEIGDLMIGYEQAEEFTRLITRLTQLGRSTGFRVVASTQYPKKEILSSIIKINCVERVGFAVNTHIESGLIIDDPILKTIKKQGETYMRINRELIRIQVPYLEDRDIEEIVEYLEKNHNEKGQYDLSEKFVSDVSNFVNSDVEMCHDENKNCVTTQIEKVEISSSDDLLKFYESNCENEVFSLNETSNYVSIGRTKIQELRKQLTNDGKLILINKKLCLVKKVNLEK